MPTRNINLAGHLNRLIAPEVDSGRYGHASDVVCEALRLTEQRNRENQARLKWLRGAVRAGLGELARGKSSHSSESRTSKSTSTSWGRKPRPRLRRSTTVDQPGALRRTRGGTLSRLHLAGFA
ncbi:ribbon-helix-helix domain-containing protein [Paludibaculum fermentans]|uniref:Type II toxin-antitoxin system ParD family antitoxin n=1 Tax=Paludibaculum fermentans TaxID=1473598 RepID=A0A7S7SIY7_PALFE|nr:type II toxin-antitoxin system ParD family antitoxin [Paludibaculum fermentans]QOY86153.1 type II toxin-antitoxin system ParD family antitoxin [Paludibaculum fermentans]